MRPHINKRFIPFVALAILAFLTGLWAGLLRIGWLLPSFPNLAMSHGPIMVSGFLGTLIALERAVAIRQKWMFVVPGICGLGWVSLLALPSLPSLPVGMLLLTLGSLGTLGILAVMVQQETKIHTITMAAGALAWVVGNILWIMGLPIFQIILFWQTFLILTIGGERLELSRILNPAPNQIRLFVLFAAALLSGAVLAIFNLDLGTRLSGLAMLLLSLWFLRNDLAARNIRHSLQLTRYIATCLYAGFIWLGVGGIFHLYFGALYAGPFYDAALHAIFVGFVISMIFGHAPIIFPAILGARVIFSPVFYVQLILLHLSLIVRVSGDLLNSQMVRKWGGLFNEVAILLFLGMTVYSIIKGNKK